MVWARMLAYITGTVDQELLLRNEYLAAEDRILKVQIKGRLLLSDGEKATLSEIAYRLGRKALREVAMVAQPETILACPQVRRLQVSTPSRAGPRARGHRESGRAHGEGEPELGL